MAREPRLLTFFNTIYRLLLFAYPTSFRREYGYHMAQVFRDDGRRTLRECGPAALIGLWCLTFVDLVKTAGVEHAAGTGSKIIEKVTPWSAPATIIGGILWSLPWSGWLGDISRATQLWMVLPALLFIMIGLTGLYRPVRSSANSSTTAFCLALIGLLIIVSAVLVGLRIGIDGTARTASVLMIFVAIGGLLMVLGIALMGIITLSSKALGVWSFLPLALAAVYFAYLITVNVFADNLPLSFLKPIFSVLTMTGWCLLAFALWQVRSQKPGMVMPGKWMKDEWNYN